MNKSFCLLIFLFCSACGSKSPKGILPQDTMEAVYWDLMKADEVVNYYGLTDTGNIKKRKQDSLYAAIFQIHNISEQQFFKSKSYYESNPEVLKVILDSMYQKGEQLQNLPQTNVNRIDAEVDSTNKENSLPVSPTKKIPLLNKQNN